MCKTFKYRLYPTKDQVQILAYCLTTCRYLYNELLEDRKNAYDRCGVGLSYIEQAGQLKYPNLGIYSQVPPDVLRRLDKAFQNFFRRVKNGEKKAGYARFQGKDRYYSFTYPQTGFKIKDGKRHLSKIGMTRIFQHREIVGKIKTCTIKQEGNQWYACFSVKLPDPEPKEITTSVGVDVGITTLATLSGGNGSAVDSVGVTEIENPKTLNKYDSTLRKAQRTLSRKKKGSSNRNKQRIVLAGVYRKVRNARKDCLHKASRILADTYDSDGSADMRTFGEDAERNIGTWELFRQTSTTRLYVLDGCTATEFRLMLNNDGDAMGEMLLSQYNGSWRGQ